MEITPKVDRRRRTQGGELGRQRIQRRSEYHRDQQTDQTVRKLGQNERDEDVVGVLRLGTRIGRQERGLGLGANGSRLAVGLEHGRTSDRLDGEILGRPGLEPGAYRLLIGRGRDGVSSFQVVKYAAARALSVGLPLRR